MLKLQSVPGLTTHCLMIWLPFKLKIYAIITKRKGRPWMGVRSEPMGYFCFCQILGSFARTFFFEPSPLESASSEEILCSFSPCQHHFLSEEWRLQWQEESSVPRCSFPTLSTLNFLGTRSLAWPSAALLHRTRPSLFLLLLLLPLTQTDQQHHLRSCHHR